MHIHWIQTCRRSKPIKSNPQNFCNAIPANGAEPSGRLKKHSSSNQPTVGKRNTPKDEWNIIFSLRSVLTVGGSVAEIEAELKRILVMKQLVHSVSPFCVGQTSRKEVKPELDMSSMGRVESHPTQALTALPSESK